MTNVILRVEKVPDRVAEQLAVDYDLIEYSKMSPGEIDAIADNIQVILASGESKVDASLIGKLPDLKLIAVFGVGYDGVDTHAAFERNVQVTNTPNVLTDDVADLGIGLMLATSRQFVGAHRFIEKGEWQSKTYPLTRKVSGGRLGIVGFGRVGQAVAKRAAGFDMKVAYFDKCRNEQFDYTYYPSLIELAGNSDYLMVCASGGPETHNLINHEILSALGKDGILINIARGSVVDEAALVAAIDGGIIAGAGLDVFAHEPMIPEAFLNRDNLVLTPHLGSATHSTRAAMARLVIDNINAFFEGRPLLTPVAK